MFNRVDPIRNILSNKLSAIFRYASKDIADIREIALHEQIDWLKAMQEACEKEAGLEITIVCEILRSMPEAEFNNIEWISSPGWQTFSRDIKNIVLALLTCGDR